MAKGCGGVHKEEDGTFVANPARDVDDDSEGRDPPRKHGQTSGWLHISIQSQCLVRDKHSVSTL